MNIRFATYTGIIPLLAALGGCGEKCEGVDCPPCSPFTDDIVVVFDRDSLQAGFRKAEIDGGYAVRFAAPGFNAPTDTVRQTRDGLNFYRGLISLRTLAGLGRPPGASQTALAASNYRFVLPALNRTYDLGNIELQTGPSDAGDCCNCGKNVRRRFTLNGVPVVLDGNANNEHPGVLRR
ncbi:hypothetical protein GCM10028824_11060 [Hymenobacter segetis]|uniref:Uncharacterized protein n=1 Tax=Hymenobacter segetis TaxID=2025509 RepID=A0ABU9LZQ7_9BACT